MADPYDLQRFVDAQAPIIDQARAELAAGRKRTHWMWFVFPQIAGLGLSAMARRFAIASRGEGRAYLAHPLLGPRLRECAGIVLGLEGCDPREIFGSPDDLKFRSSMTLFGTLAPEAAVFARALDKYYGGQPDARTLEALEALG